MDRTRNIYALFSMCNPELLEQYKTRFSNSDKVAARLIANKHKFDASVCVRNIENQKHWFKLDLATKIYRSKGDWIWVKQIDIHFPKESLICINFNPRVLDLPYINNNICAHWLFKTISQELSEQLDVYL